MALARSVGCVACLDAKRRSMATSTCSLHNRSSLCLVNGTVAQAALLRTCRLENMEVQCKCEMPPGATAPLAWLLFCPTLNHLCTLFVTTELGNHEPFVGQLVINVLVRHGLLWHLMRSWQIHKVCHSHELRLNILGMYCRAVEGQAQRAGAEVTLNLRRTYKVRCHVLHRPTFLKSDTAQEWSWHTWAESKSAQPTRAVW